MCDTCCKGVMGGHERKSVGVLKDKDLALAGDESNNSPGLSTRYCVYTLMEHYLHITVDLQVVDKRETGVLRDHGETCSKRLTERAMKDLSGCWPPSHFFLHHIPYFL